MPKQLSDCCKATIDLDKTKERPECYTCSKCDRIIGSPLPPPTMNQIPNIGETNTREVEEWEKKFDMQFAKGFYNGDWVLFYCPTSDQKDEHPATEEDVKAFIHQQLQKARHDWLREEIVKLEGIKPDLSIYTLFGKPMIEWDFEEVAKYTKDLGTKESLQTIIDRYLLELNEKEV